eukprot:TRINITY_DN6257_c0_g2_i1.p2 TRINITY_DN6257_c0_g2~~TRINITY_DN6257_c0_g2_i1.p2  ORF type:complete len:150 (-),score=15.69 TRINITY_DN6257_c0_g2_i1:538-987(-)
MNNQQTSIVGALERDPAQLEPPRHFCGAHMEHAPASPVNTEETMHSPPAKKARQDGVGDCGSTEWAIGWFVGLLMMLTVGFGPAGFDLDATWVEMFWRWATGMDWLVMLLCGGEGPDFALCVWTYYMRRDFVWAVGVVVVVQLAVDFVT